MSNKSFWVKIGPTPGGDIINSSKNPEEVELRYEA
jgi:hypothetical protein